MRTPLAAILLLACCVAAACCRADAPAGALDYRNQVQIAPAARFGGTVIGGLSAISYDPGRQQYYVISDDRSEHGPARFYTVRITLSDSGSGAGSDTEIDDVVVTAVTPFADESGRPFPPPALKDTPPVVPPDPEGIAFDAARQRLYWCSEGERLADGVLADPWVRIAGLDGSYLGQFALPPGHRMSAQLTGPRRNAALEGLTLTPSGRFLFVAMEEPGYQDGDVPSRDHGALTRITKFDVDTRTPVAQYAYPLAPAPPGAETIGIPDLLALDDTTFLVLEKAGTAHPPVVRVYRAEIGAATDVLELPSLAGPAVTPMAKTLLADFADAPGLTPLDNVEGLTLGPKLPDGRQSVLMVSDDNFNPAQVTQFLLFAM